MKTNDVIKHLYKVREIKFKNRAGSIKTKLISVQKKFDGEKIDIYLECLHPEIRINIREIEAIK